MNSLQINQLVPIRVRIQRLMDDKNWNQEQLARATKLHINHIQAILSATTLRPQRKTMLKIVRAFGMDIDELVIGTDWPRDHTPTQVISGADTQQPERTTNLEPAHRVFKYYSGEQALGDIAERIGKAKVVLNTSITANGLPAFKTPAMDEWVEAAIKSIHTRTVFKDVVSEAWLSRAKARIAEVKRAKKQKERPALYQCRLISCPLGGFMNFTVFEYRDGTKEVFFGWLVSGQQGFEQPCVSSNETHVVQLFETWHGQLFAGGREVR